MSQDENRISDLIDGGLIKEKETMKKERLKPGPKPKEHVRFQMRVTKGEKKKCIAFYEQLKKDRINNPEVKYMLKEVVNELNQIDV